MNIMQLLLISIGLAMDAFAVSICKGLCVREIDFKVSFKIGLYFGGFQAFMPVIGYFLGDLFDEFLLSIDHWIAFGLLMIIGANMIFETMTNNRESFSEEVNFKSMFVPALATSIDALAVGFTFAFLRVNIFISALIIGIVALLFTFVGVRIGNKVGNKFESKAKILGGIILIFIAVKILIEHIGV